MKIEKMKQVIEWAEKQTPEIQAKIANSNSLELQLFAGCELSKKNRKMLIIDYLNKSKMSTSEMAFQTAIYSIENKMENLSPDEVCFQFVMSKINLEL
jgi:hypothetical protein